MINLSATPETLNYPPWPFWEDYHFEREVSGAGGEKKHLVSRAILYVVAAIRTFPDWPNGARLSVIPIS